LASPSRRDGLDFDQRQKLLRLAIDVRVTGWNIEIRLRIPVDEHTTETASTSVANTRPRQRSESPRNPNTKEQVSSNV